MSHGEHHFHPPGDPVYEDLRERLDKYPIGAPQTEAMMEILGYRFSPEDAKIAAQMPLRPRPLKYLSKSMGIKENVLQAHLERMAEKGLVIDVPFNDEINYLLAPTVVGFIEFTFMRNREKDFSNKRMAEILNYLMFEDPTFMERVCPPGSKTPLGRTLPHEAGILEKYDSEVLDYERATVIVSEAKSRSVGTCYCRQKQAYLDRRCKAPLEVCMSLGKAADYMVRRGMGRMVSQEEALDILAMTRDAGLVHIGDNVQNKVSFICQCCGCCCGMLKGITHWHIESSVATSCFIASSNNEKCSGCGKCEKVCPVNAISMKGEKKERKPHVDNGVCIGCGVCVLRCAFKALELTPRKQRVFTPQNTFEKFLRMSMERGTLHHTLFNDPNRWTHRTAEAFVGGLLSLPAAKRILARESIKSIFVSLFLGKKKMDL